MAITEIALGQPSIATAVHWAEATLMGVVATSLAALSISLVGLAMLAGELSPKRTLRAVLGCFILFGAPAIAREIADAAHVGDPASAVAQPAAAPPKLPAEAPEFDPYAGASTPM